MWTKEEIGLVIKNTRMTAGLTQSQVAKALGRPQQTIANWEVGRSQPDANTLFELFKLLGADLNTSFGFFPEQKKSPSTDESAQEEEQAGTDPLRSTLLHNFDQLNQEGRERLVETSDDMVSSGKYIKSNPNQLGNEKYA